MDRSALAPSESSPSLSRFAPTLLLVALADVVLRVPLGLGATLFVLVAATFLAARQPDASRRVGPLALLISAAGLAVALAFGGAPLALALALLALVTAACHVRGARPPTALHWPLAWCAFAANAARVLPADARRAWRDRDPEPRSRDVTSWIVPFVVVVVFGGLVAVANPLIADALGRISASLRGLLEPDPLRWSLWAAVALAGWQLLSRHALNVPELHLPVAPSGATLDRWLGPTTLVRSLLLANAIFAVNGVLDGIYLWGDAALPQGVTLAGYAHSGMFPLVLAALLAAAFVLVAFREGAATSEEPACRALVHLWLVQAAWICACAAARLHAYVEGYGLTRLRVSAAACMALVAAGLLLVAWRIHSRRTNAWLIGANVALVLVVLGTASVVDVDGFIAWHDVLHCREVTGGDAPRVDVDYVASLGTESLPALAWLAQQQGPAARKAQLAFYFVHARLRHETSDWRSWTLRRARLINEHPEPLPEAVAQQPY